VTTFSVSMPIFTMCNRAKLLSSSPTTVASTRVNATWAATRMPRSGLLACPIPPPVSSLSERNGSNRLASRAGSSPNSSVVKAVTTTANMITRPSRAAYSARGSPSGMAGYREPWLTLSASRDT
jgi:hypothetical protein